MGSLMQIGICIVLRQTKKIYLHFRPPTSVSQRRGGYYTIVTTSKSQ